METILIATIIGIILLIIITWFILTYNHFQEYIIKINEAEAKIDGILRKRFDLLNKSINIIKAHIETEEEILEEIVKLRSRKLVNFELDRKLYEGINEFNLYKEKYPELNKIDNFIKIDVSLNASEIEITAARNYYNDIITEYNKLVKVFPSNIIAKLYKYSYRNFYDEKNMHDQKNNNFKL